MLMGFGLNIPNWRTGGGVSAAAAFLATNGPHGMVLDFADASIAIDDAANLLDLQSQGQVSGGALVGPGAKLTYTAPSLKLTEQADGNLGFQAHNLYLNSAAPANQSITVLSGASYAITITGSVSMVASGAAAGTWTAGTTTFTAATGTLTLGSTSGTGTVHLRRTPSVDTYIATTSAAAYDLPYVYSGGVLQSILPEPAATNLVLRSEMRTGAVAGTPGTAPTGWVYGQIGGTSTVETSGGLFGAGYLRITTTSARQYVAQSVSLSANTSYRISLRANVRVAQSMSNTLTAVGLPAGATLSGWTANGAPVLISDTTPVGPVLLEVTLSVAATAGAAELRFGVGCSASVSADIDLYQAQFETGTVATSPIITYGSTVLRAADTPNALLSLFPSIGTAYTIYAKYKPQSASVSTEAIRLDDTTTNELVSLGNNASGQGLATVTDGGAAQAAITSGTITASTFHRVAASVEGNNVRFVVNGGAEVQDTSVTLPTLTRLLLTAGGGMELAQLAILPGARTEAQLQALGA